MARISGIDLSPNKRVEYGLTAIFGIGLHTAKKIVTTVGIDPLKKIKELNDEEITKIRKLIELDYKVEGALRAEIATVFFLPFLVRAFVFVRCPRADNPNLCLDPR